MDLKNLNRDKPENRKYPLAVEMSAVMKNCVKGGPTEGGFSRNLGGVDPGFVFPVSGK